MKELNVHKVALTFGFLLGGGHLVWSILIVLGLAQPLLDFIFWMHMLDIPHRVMSFNLTQSVTLVIVTGVIGYGFGWVFASVWNRMHK